jgi:hypothetical protein
MRHGTVSSKVGRLEPRLYHVPPEGALRTQQGCHAQERIAQGSRKVRPDGKVAEWEGEGKADCVAEDAVVPSYIVDRLEVIERHA